MYIKTTEVPKGFGSNTTSFGLEPIDWDGKPFHFIVENADRYPQIFLYEGENVWLYTVKTPFRDYLSSFMMWAHDTDASKIDCPHLLVKYGWVLE